ncbi:MAG: helix-turn-helix transcriptional regulator [Chitinophagaceae bacterium]|nr:helix-turn-helix transcriptional regulator [Chitinophagaceae bacterium]MCW5928330.1 helix-turn-helix transcriptional regulator [Chitinophagaceae bacterium]
MNQYFLTKESQELVPFPHILEFAFKKSNTVQFDSLKKNVSEFLRFYYVVDGRLSWVIDGNHCILYPGDLAVILPGQIFGGERDLMEPGTVFWIEIQLGLERQDGRLSLGKWCLFTENECRAISRVLFSNNSPVVSKFREAGNILQTMQAEFQSQEIGFTTRINQLLHDLIILTTRHLTSQNSSRRDFPQSFIKLEQTLRDNLSHQWTVDEMAVLMALGATAFSERVKNFTGFSPLNYLINIRISEAIKLLKQSDRSVTDIALEVGFYSSQHFATTFKKLTGYTPSEFRKNNNDN